MKEIFAITDNRGFFGSKHNAVPYNSGMDQTSLKKFFNENGYELKFIKPYSIVFDKDFWNGKIVLYTSTEDRQLHYKSYLEDVVMGLEMIGAIVIPKYKFLKANNNKVFMEILRDSFGEKEICSIKSKKYGTLEEFKEEADSLHYPIVIKTASGALSRGVSLAKNKKEALKQIEKISRTKHLKTDFWEFGREKKHKGYLPQSSHRKKFIVQNFIEGLSNDWKILIFNNKYYVLRRNVRPNDFRASGSGILSYTKEIPKGILEFSEKIMKTLNIPNGSIDIAHDGKNFHLIEFQAIFFGSYTISYSKFYYTKNKNGEWSCVEENSTLEQEYTNSIISFINKI